MRASHTNVIQKSPECYPIVTHWHIAAINEMMRSVVAQGLPTFFSSHKLEANVTNVTNVLFDKTAK